jgi:hypothetical protein
MKRKKAFFIIPQILTMILINYFSLIEDGFIYKTHWQPSVVFVFVFFHFGTVIALYATIKSITYTKERRQMIHNFNFFIYISYIGLLCFHNCLVVSGDLLFNYCLGIFLLIISVIFLFETYSSYKKYTASLIINN